VATRAKVGAHQPLGRLGPVGYPPRLHLEVLDLLAEIGHVLGRERLGCSERSWAGGTEEYQEQERVSAVGFVAGSQLASISKRAGKS
jgi:hypothetical protein